MSQYPLTALGEVLTLAPDPVPVEFEESYQTAGIYSFGRGLFTRPPIAGADTKYKTLYRLHKNQLVLSRLKAWEGAVAVVSEKFDHLYVSQEYPTFALNLQRAEPAYLAQLCRWDRFWESLRTEAKGIGARRDRVHPDRLLAVRIPLPPLEEQRRLARRIDFIAWRAQKARRLRLTASDTSTRLIGSILGQFNRSAPKVPLGEVLSLATDEVAVSLDRTYQIAGVYSFGHGLLARAAITGAETKYKKLFRLHQGQFVLSRLKAWEGAVAIVTADFDGMYVSQEYPTLEVNLERAEPSYQGES